jgi:hypothetical protein
MAAAAAKVMVKKSRLDDVLATGVLIGRIFKANAAPVGGTVDMDARFSKHGCVATRQAAMAVGMPKHNRVMIWVDLSNARRTAYGATIVGRGFARRRWLRDRSCSRLKIREPMRHAASIPASTATVR